MCVRNYYKSRSREIGCYNERIALQFDRHPGSVAADVPVNLHSDWRSYNPNFAALNFKRYYGKTPVRLVNGGPVVVMNAILCCIKGVTPGFNNRWIIQNYPVYKANKTNIRYRGTLFGWDSIRPDKTHKSDMLPYGIFYCWYPITIIIKYIMLFYHVIIPEKTNVIMSYNIAWFDLVYLPTITNIPRKRENILAQPYAIWYCIFSIMFITLNPRTLVACFHSHRGNRLTDWVNCVTAIPNTHRNR